MKPSAALVVADIQDGPLADALFATGLAPVFRRTLESALDALRRDRFDLIVVDRDHARVDVLEFVLNVRDFDASTPVLVSAAVPDPEHDRALGTQPGAKVVLDPPRSPAFRRCVEQLVSGPNRQSRS